jgi:hypothetical protein
MIGAVLSETVTVCVAVAVRPSVSVAVYVIVVVPTGKKFPAGTPVRITLTVQSPVVVGVPSSDSPTTNPHDPTTPAGVSTLTCGGAVTVGAAEFESHVLELTIISCVQVEVKPDELVTVHVI